MKIKIFKEMQNLGTLEDKVNEFLEEFENEEEIIDVRYICNDYSCSCMVIYSEYEM